MVAFGQLLIGIGLIMTGGAVLATAAVVTGAILYQRHELRKKGRYDG